MEVRRELLKLSVIGVPGGSPMMPYFNSLAGRCLRAVHNDRACDAPSHCAGSSLAPCRLRLEPCPSSGPNQEGEVAVTPDAITSLSEPQSLDALNFWAIATATFFTP